MSLSTSWQTPYFSMNEYKGVLRHTSVHNTNKLYQVSPETLISLTRDLKNETGKTHVDGGNSLFKLLHRDCKFLCLKLIDLELVDEFDIRIILRFGQTYYMEAAVHKGLITQDIISNTGNKTIFDDMNFPDFLITKNLLTAKRTMELIKFALMETIRGIHLKSIGEVYKSNRVKVPDQLKKFVKLVMTSCKFFHQHSYVWAQLQLLLDFEPDLRHISHRDTIKIFVCLVDSMRRIHCICFNDSEDDENDCDSCSYVPNSLRYSLNIFRKLIHFGLHPPEELKDYISDNPIWYKEIQQELLDEITLAQTGVGMCHLTVKRNGFGMIDLPVSFWQK